MIQKKTLNAKNQQELSVSQTENANITYNVNWTVQLGSDTISTSTWTSEDSGVTISGETNTTTTTTARFSGDPGRYRIINKIVTAAGDTDERFVDLQILENTKYYSTDWGYYNWRW